MSHGQRGTILDVSQGVLNDIADLLLGEHLASGSTREVYVHAIYPQHVVKIESRDRSFQNAIEWRIWNEVKNTKNARWFAPCIAISPGGTCLIQERTEPLDGHLPPKIPWFFDDARDCNWGRMGRQFVCHDYSYMRITDALKKPAPRLVKFPNKQTKAFYL